jgi:hypothetical protein
MAIKTYSGRRLPDPHVIVVIEDYEKRLVYSHPLKHVEHHSPTGFEWGYGGSGPADLALSILTDYFHEKWGRVTKEHINQGVHPAVVLHQDFKWSFVAAFPPEWKLHKEEIDAWTSEREIAKTIEDAGRDLSEWEYLKMLDQMVDEA